jgi:hypothetical protein
MGHTKEEWRLPRWWPALIVPPLVAFALTNFILTQWGQSSFELAQPMLADGNAEAAGRLRAGATFLLLCALGAAGLIYSAIIVARLVNGTRYALLLAWLASMALGIAIVFATGLHQGDPYLERDFACKSFDLLPGNYAPPTSDREARRLRSVTPPAVLAKGPAPQRGSFETLKGCRQGASHLGRLPLYRQSWTILPVPEARYSQDSYRTLRLMYAISALLLFLAMPALVWAAIACLALPAGSDEERREAWLSQTSRLNRLLYITAGFMVAGLLFTSARMMWPAYSLHPGDLPAFSRHVSSFVLFTGISNSLLIAAYYIPVATWLAKLRPPQSEAEDEQAKGPDPFAAFKTAATILSPALIALLNEMLKFTG